jgi:hypothetical protein
VLSLAALALSTSPASPAVVRALDRIRTIRLGAVVRDVGSCTGSVRAVYGTIDGQPIHGYLAGRERSATLKGGARVIVAEVVQCTGRPDLNGTLVFAGSSRAQELAGYVDWPTATLYGNRIRLVKPIAPGESAVRVYAVVSGRLELLSNRLEQTAAFSRP